MIVGVRRTGFVDRTRECLSTYASARKDQIEDCMPELASALLKFGHRPALRPRSEAARGIAQQRLVTQHFQHNVRVRLPVRG